MDEKSKGLLNIAEGLIINENTQVNADLFQNNKYEIEKTDYNSTDNELNTSKAEKLHLSLILSEGNKVSVDFYPTDDLDKICIELCKIKKIDLSIARKLKRKIEEQLNIFQNQTNDLDKAKDKVLINRLYTEAVKRKIIKYKFFEKIKKDNLEKEINSYSFSPKILEKSNLLNNRKYMKIEDKLFYDEIKLKEKRIYQRMIIDIHNKELYQSRLVGSKVHNKSQSKFIFNFPYAVFIIKITSNLPRPIEKLKQPSCDS